MNPKIASAPKVFTPKNCNPKSSDLRKFLQPKKFIPPIILTLNLNFEPQKGLTPQNIYPSKKFTLKYI